MIKSQSPLIRVAQCDRTRFPAALLSFSRDYWSQVSALPALLPTVAICGVCNLLCLVDGGFLDVRSVHRIAIAVVQCVKDDAQALVAGRVASLVETRRVPFIGMCLLVDAMGNVPSQEASYVALNACSVAGDLKSRRQVRSLNVQVCALIRPSTVGGESDGVPRMQSLVEDSRTVVDML